MATPSRAVAGFLRDERGATAIENALVAGLVSVSVVAGATRVGDWAGRTYGAVASGAGP